MVFLRNICVDTLNKGGIDDIIIVIIILIITTKYVFQISSYFMGCVFKMWCWRWVKISWTALVKSEEILHGVKEEWIIIHTVKKEG
jgi:hypothetical protein